MSTIILDRLPTVRIFEDNRPTPPKQIAFPCRRHSSSLKKTISTTPATRWKQQTLTQITPTLSHASSSHSSFDGVNDLEYDNLDPVMPPKKRPRKSGTPKPKPKPQRQTITQMDPFKKQIHPPEDVEDLAEEYVPAPATAPNQKKRKITSTTPTASTIQTRSSKRKSGRLNVNDEATPPSYLEKQDISVADPEAASFPPQSQELHMPPPKTPQRPRRKIVPSSQSPAETPISIHSRKSGEHQTVTPLGERSVNTPSKSRLTSRRKRVQWAPKLVVADSTNWEDEDTEALFPPTVHNRPSQQKHRSSQSQSPSDQLTPRTPSSVERFVNGLFGSPHNNPRQSSQRTLKRKATIADSEDEDRNSPSAKPGKRNTIPSQKPDTPFPHPTVTDKTVRPTSTNQHTQNSQQSKPQPQTVQHESVPTQLIHPENENSPTTPKHSPNQGNHTSPINSSDSEEASTQPKFELLHSSSPPAPPPRPPALETESQFENAWRELTPPQLDPEAETNNNNDMEQQQTVEEPTLPPIPPRSIINRPSTIEHDNTHHHHHHLPPVPPSQATTTDDITQQATPQHSHLHPYNESQQILGSSSPTTQHPQQFLPSSSPFRSRRKERQQAPPPGTTGMGYEGWDGVRMTESQLLPRSFLDDSLEVPEMFLRREEEEGGLDLDLDFEEDLGEDLGGE
ncbi:MAG: hypothetical protein Q9216_007119 [Gyalolechia sp. 2 TL-2023]